MKVPFFSIIIPVYNAKATLFNCLRKIYESDFEDFEVIIIDDNSKDQSYQIAQNFNCKIVRLNKNCGEGLARNKGAEIACGKYLFFLDSDIYLNSDTLKILHHCINSSNVDCISAVYEKKSIYRNPTSVFKHLYDSYYMHRQIETSNQFCCSAVAIRRDVFNSSGWFRPQFRCNADRELSFRLHSKGYSIIHEPKAKVWHDKRYNLRKMLKVSFMRGSYSTRVYLNLKGIRSKGSGAQLGYLTGFALLPIFFITLLMGKMMLSIIVLIVYYLFHSKFLYYIKSSEGYKYALMSLPLLIIDNLTILVGVIGGLLCSLKEKKFNYGNG